MPDGFVVTTDAFVAVTANTAPSSLNATLDTVSVALVAPGTATPSRVHA